MTDELGREVLVEWAKKTLKYWQTSELSHVKALTNPNLVKAVESDIEHLKQIVALIKKPGVTEEKGHEEMTEHELRTEVLKLRAKVNRLQQKPEVTEEWYDEKARGLVKISYVNYPPLVKMAFHAISLGEAKDFIRSLVEEIK